ncbi:Haloacid dehalogenase-like hydrolase protein [Rutstroemia sp. NJR-2017a BVV2]|nr:Haloacid dehalogenase-like hydrolase protein [Rutstroemia sp. NJR-2017a BVV2]
MISIPPTQDHSCFILDFDGTITTKDTIDVVMNVGITHQKDNGQDYTTTVEDIVEKYTKDYSSHIEKYQPRKEERKTLEQEVAYQRNLKDVEHRSFDRVSTSGIFRGISEAGWEKAGRNAVRAGNVSIRNGFKAFVELIEASKCRWAVVSVNFSRSFIMGVLQEALERESLDVSILSNSPGIDGILKGPSFVDVDSTSERAVMATSDEKLNALEYLLNQLKLPSSQTVFYFGDSGTDIECLTRNDTNGVVVSDDGESSLMRTLSKIERRPESINKMHAKESDERVAIYWTRDFEEFGNIWPNIL